MENTNIIAAYSGGSLPAAIAIVRMSGEGCIGLLGKIFRPKSGKPMTECKNNTMIYGELSACDGRTIDICLACVYRAPHSYTGEDMAEIAKLDIGRSEIVDHSDPKFIQMLHQMKIHA